MSRQWTKSRLQSDINEMTDKLLSSRRFRHHLDEFSILSLYLYYSFIQTLLGNWSHRFVVKSLPCCFQRTGSLFDERFLPGDPQRWRCCSCSLEWPLDTHCQLELLLSCYPCQSAEPEAQQGAEWRGRRQQSLISSLSTFGRWLIIPVSTLRCEARRSTNGTQAEPKRKRK